MPEKSKQPPQNHLKPKARKHKPFLFGSSAFWHSMTFPKNRIEYKTECWVEN